MCKKTFADLKNLCSTVMVEVSDEDSAYCEVKMSDTSILYSHKHLLSNIQASIDNFTND